MGLLEQIQELGQAVDAIMSQALEAAIVIETLEKKMETLNMDTALFLASAKQIDDATTAIGARVTAMAKIISDNSATNAAVDAAVVQLKKDADALTALGRATADPQAV